VLRAFCALSQVPREQFNISMRATTILNSTNNSKKATSTTKPAPSIPTTLVNNNNINGVDNVTPGEDIKQSDRRRLTRLRGSILSKSLCSDRTFQKPLRHHAPESFTTKKLHAWAKDTLPDVVKQPLFDINGKKTKSMRHKNILFTSEYRFRHIIPFLYLGDFLDAESQKNLEQVSFLAKQFSELKTEYGSVDTDPIRGFENYKNFQDETELNKNRIHLHSAALL
jgi:hypothetical protein